MELSENWRAAVADEELRRSWLEDGVSAAWAPIEVPGHWRSNDAFAETDGALLYRTDFERARPAEGERAWLRFEGLFYQGDVWLDGAYVGDTEGYFFPHTFEVTEALAARTEHVLGVELACSPASDRRAKRNITGVFDHSDSLDPGWNPGGIWRPVTIERSGPIRIVHHRVVCREAGPERAVVALRAVLDAAAPGTATLRTRIGAVEHLQELNLAGGENQIEWLVTVPEPKLWWPRALGEQPLSAVTIDITCEGDDQPSDHKSLRTGLRQVTMRNWITSVNGERLFLKGANLGPTRMALAEATPEELAADVSLAVDAGLDLLRIHAHVTRPELYHAADEAGLLIWQDFPLQWGYARGIRKQAMRQAREMVDLLGHHPSVAIWCGHNEPLALDRQPDEPADSPAGIARFFAGQELPTWNKTVLDRSVKRTIEQADPSRPVISHSGVLPHPPLLDGTDTHIWFGWYHGDERDLPAWGRRLPRLMRFVSEFGAQAIPEADEFMEPERWPDLDWDRLARTHGLQKLQFDRYVPPANHVSFEAWKAATGEYQSTVIKHHIETLRRLKYQPTGGFAVYSFADGHPSVSWSVLDHDRNPKPGFATLRDACRPVIVVADRLPAELAAGDTIALDIHVISDLRADLGGARIDATLSWLGGRHEWHWGGDIEPDSCQRVGTLQFVTPDAPGPLRLDLALTAVEHDTTNRYDAVIAPPR